jgi:hypothetical protein
MVDGFLLFTIVDVWRMVLPLGLTLILCVTALFNLWPGGRYYEAVCEVLSPLVFRLTVSLLIISVIVGLWLPAVLRFPIPEPHIAVGPWGNEEMLGYLLGVVCLWQTCRQRARGTKVLLAWPTCAAVLFLGIGVLWIGRWEAMAHAGNVPGGWFVLEWSTVDWSRVVPKVLHLLFSSLVAGGCLVAVLGLTGWLGAVAGPSSGSHVPPFSSPVVIRYGVGWMLLGLVPQMLVGPWLFFMLGEGPRGGLIDGTGLVSALFFVSVMVALVALVLLNASFMAPHVKGLVWGGLSGIAITLVLMGMIRYVVFLTTLQSHGIPIAIGSVTPFHLLTVLVLTGLLAAILVRWCVQPHDVFHSDH